MEAFAFFVFAAGLASGIFEKEWLSATLIFSALFMFIIIDKKKKLEKVKVKHATLYKKLYLALLAVYFILFGWFMYGFISGSISLSHMLFLCAVLFFFVHHTEMRFYQLRNRFEDYKK